MQVLFDGLLDAICTLFFWGTGKQASVTPVGDGG